MLPIDDPNPRSVNETLAAWGEPPADEAELALADLLACVLESRPTNSVVAPETEVRLRDPQPRALLDVCRRIDEMISTLLGRSGLFEAPAGVELRLAVSRLVSGAYQPVASTHPRPFVVRDLKRIPDDPDRVVLCTGDRVRIEVSSNRTGYVTVFNVGPRGGLNLLYPAVEGEQGLVDAHKPLLVPGIELTPPAGRERVFAVWSVAPLAAIRDLLSVQESLADRREHDWHAVLLELDHRA